MLLSKIYFLRCPEVKLEIPNLTSGHLASLLSDFFWGVMPRGWSKIRLFGDHVRFRVVAAAAAPFAFFAYFFLVDEEDDAKG